MNVKMAVVISAGRVSGRMMWKKLLNGPQPSILAASSSSRGSPRMNCTMRKTKNASMARNLGRMSGQYVFTRPSLLKMMYCGISTAWCGSMIVAIMNANSGPRIRNRSRANAYAASEQLMTLPRTAPPAISRELVSSRVTETPFTPSSAVE